MGQWLKAIGGYTVEQIGKYLFIRRRSFTIISKPCRLLPLRNDRIRDRLYTRLCYLD